jgi:hypothetical protein
VISRSRWSPLKVRSSPAVLILTFPTAPSVDLDILIRPSDLARAADLLSRSGYIVRCEDEALLGLLNRPYEYHASFVRRSSGTVVELHWAFNGIHDRTKLDIEGMLRRAQAVPVLGVPVMSSHGGRHSASSLRSWLSASVVATEVACGRSLSLEWDGTDRLDSTGARSSQSGCYRILTLGLGLTHDILGVPLPEPILRNIRNDRIVRKLMAVHRRVHPREPSAHSPGEHAVRDQCSGGASGACQSILGCAVANLSVSPTKIFLKARPRG